ncbi:DNA recombination and repair protein RecO [Labilithrix luteola]|uniref:DNA repair protein RecO n=1 Tax=Labilithrix luteola TaxID=1391654 RepID=A0A0K1Q8B9_9BACT|nr:DNA repair protein RecO [Labilithrix luteola]AKV01650.1 DNA recombination and repair protein RecO [Labilithrix luteola]
MKVVDSAALLVRSVPYGESDLVATFFTETEGRVGAVLRGARRSTKRFGGTLEPIHELVVRLEDRGRELCVLKEARIARPRQGIVSSLAAMEGAGRALRWVRHLCPNRTPEPRVWHGLRDLLDALDASREGAGVGVLLVTFGLRLLAETGYALDFERCARCGKLCPPGRPAFVDAASGGLVCMNCGGARRTMGGELRAIAARLSNPRSTGTDASELAAVTDAHASELLLIIEEAMAAHTDFAG